MIRKLRWKHVFIKQPFHRGAICYLRDINSKLSIYYYFYFSWIWILSSSYFLLTTYLIYEFLYAYRLIRQYIHWSIGGNYSNVIMGAVTSQITSLAIVYSTVFSDADQRKHQGSASLAFVRGIHRGPVNSPHKGPVTRKMLPFDDVIMESNKWIFSPILA